MVRLKLLDTAKGVLHPASFHYVAYYDPEYHLPNGEYDGGELRTTMDPKKAMVFADVSDATALWRAHPTCPCHQYREDGELNRPLTAFHVEVA